MKKKVIFIAFLIAILTLATARTSSAQAPAPPKPTAERPFIIHYTLVERPAYRDPSGNRLREFLVEIDGATPKLPKKTRGPGMAVVNGRLTVKEVRPMSIVVTFGGNASDCQAMKDAEQFTKNLFEPLLKSGKYKLKFGGGWMNDKYYQDLPVCEQFSAAPPVLRFCLAGLEKIPRM